MKSVFQALYTLFNTTNDFKTAVDGQFYPGVADQENATFPYAVYHLITDNADWTFSEEIEYLSIQVSVFDDNTSPTRVFNTYESLRTLFDDATLTVTGYDHVRMHRENMQLVRDEPYGVWHLIVDYEIEIQRERT